jgi:hypothetical protein
MDRQERQSALESLAMASLTVQIPITAPRGADGPVMIPNELWRMLGVECVVNSPPGRDPALLLKQEGAQCSAWI